MEWTTSDDEKTCRWTVGPRPVECKRCGARFPWDETHPASGGYCVCGGDLVLDVHCDVLFKRPLLNVEWTITVG